ncbi:hypothetical protein D3C72_834890 [compost metagenome]
MSAPARVIPEETLAYWIALAQRRGEEIALLSGALAVAHGEEDRNLERADRLANENARLVEQVRALEAKVEELGAEWLTHSRRAMALELENARLKRGEPEAPAPVEPAPVVPVPRPKPKAKAKPKGAPRDYSPGVLRRHPSRAPVPHPGRDDVEIPSGHRLCGNIECCETFRPSFHNRVYHATECTPLHRKQERAASKKEQRSA